MIYSIEIINDRFFPMVNLSGLSFEHIDIWWNTSSRTISDCRIVTSPGWRVSGCLKIEDAAKIILMANSQPKIYSFDERNNPLIWDNGFRHYYDSGKIINN